MNVKAILKTLFKRCSLSCSLLQRSLSYSFLNPQFTSMISINSQSVFFNLVDKIELFRDHLNLLGMQLLKVKSKPS